MPRKRSKLCLFVAGACLLLATGCRGSALSKMLDQKGPPPEIVARYGPTAGERIEQIRRIGESIGEASPAEQQKFAETLAQQIRTESDPTVREAIIDSIAGCPSPVTAQVLRAGVHDEDLDVRIAAAEAWGRWGGNEAVQVLGQLLANSETDFDVRLAAADSLARVNQPGAVQALGIAVQSREDPALQYRAAQSLAKITGLDHGNNLVAWRDYVQQQGGPLVANSNLAPSSGTPASNVAGQGRYSWQ